MWSSSRRALIRSWSGLTAFVPRRFGKPFGVMESNRYLSSDHDPLFRFHQWEANLRILNIKEIKTVPEVPRIRSSKD